MAGPIRYSDITPGQMANARKQLGQLPTEITDNPSIFNRLGDFIMSDLEETFSPIQSYVVDPIKDFLAPDPDLQPQFDPFYDPYGEERDYSAPFMKDILGSGMDFTPLGDVSFPSAGMGQLLDENQMKSILRAGMGFIPFGGGTALEWDEMGPKMRALSVGTDLLDIPTAGAGGALAKGGIKFLPDAINVLKDVSAPLVQNIPGIKTLVGPITIKKTNKNRLEHGGSAEFQVSKGTNVLSSTTEGGKYIVEDISSTARALAADPARVTATGELKKAEGGKSYAFSHSEPVFDIIDAATGDPIMRVTLHPTFNEKYRFARFDEYDEWAMMTDVLPHQQLKPQDFYKNKRDWNMDVAGMGQGTREAIDPEDYRELIDTGFKGFEGGDDEYWEVLDFDDLTRKGSIPNRKDMIAIGEAIGVRLNATSLTGLRIPSGLKGPRLQHQSVESMQKMLDVRPWEYMTNWEKTKGPVLPLTEGKKKVVMDFWEDVFDNSVGIPSAIDDVADEVKISGKAKPLFQGPGAPVRTSDSKVDFRGDFSLGNSLPELETAAPFDISNRGRGPTIRWDSKDFSMDDVVNSYLGDVIEKNMNESRELLKKLKTEDIIFNVDPNEHLTDYQIMVLYQTAKHEARVTGDVPSQVFIRLLDDHSTRAWGEVETYIQGDLFHDFRNFEANGYAGVPNNPVLNAYFHPDISKATKDRLAYHVAGVQSGTSGYASGIQDPSLLTQRPQEEYMLRQGLQTSEGMSKFPDRSTPFEQQQHQYDLDTMLIPFQELQLPRELP